MNEGLFQMYLLCHSVIKYQVLREKLYADLKKGKMLLPPISKWLKHT